MRLAVDAVRPKTLLRSVSPNSLPCARSRDVSLPTHLPMSHPSYEVELLLATLWHSQGAEKLDINHEEKGVATARIAAESE